MYMIISSLEQILSEQYNTGNLTEENIAAALEESKKTGEYLYNIRNANLKGEIYELLLVECSDTTTMYVD